MSENSQTPVTIFVHVPKTAGTALDRVVERSYRQDQLYSLRMKRPEFYRDDIARVAREKPQTLRFISGHAPYGLHELLPGPTRYITILRDPVERLVSFYHYARKMPKHHLYEELTSGGMNIVGLARRIANQQVRYLSGRLAGVPDEADFARAKENLDRSFIVAGLTERFDETLAMFQLKLGWPLRGYTRENVNVAKPKSSILTADELKEIRSCHEMDCEIYESVSKRFAAQVEEEGEAFRLQVKNLGKASKRAQFFAALTRPFRRKPPQAIG